MRLDELQASIGGSVFAGGSALVVPVPDPVKQAAIALGAAVIGWATTVVLNWLKKRLGGA